MEYAEFPDKLIKTCQEPTPLPDSNIQPPRVSALAIEPAASPAPAGILSALGRLFTTARKLHEREKSRIRGEIARVPGLMALLMKPRNGQKWTRAERAELRAQLRGLSRLGLYLITAVTPGTSLTLPLLAWWLDRRQRQRDGDPSRA
ncbi:MAG: hypothetical protein HY083_07210 [Gammaproteobacteria bacterium]|nr:hypothetical protein [Gammaproteobacteria bacterium]